MLAVWLQQVSEAEEAERSISQSLWGYRTDVFGQKNQISGTNPTPLGSPLATSTASCEVASGSSQRGPTLLPQVPTKPLLLRSPPSSLVGRGVWREGSSRGGWGSEMLSPQGTAF